MKKIELRRLGVTAVLLDLSFVGDDRLLKGKAEGGVRELQFILFPDEEKRFMEAWGMALMLSVSRMKVSYRSLKPLWRMINK